MSGLIQRLFDRSAAALPAASLALPDAPLSMESFPLATAPMTNAPTAFPESPSQMDLADAPRQAEAPLLDPTPQLAPPNYRIAPLAELDLPASQTPRPDLPQVETGQADRPTPPILAPALPIAEPFDSPAPASEARLPSPPVQPEPVVSPPALDSPDSRPVIPTQSRSEPFLNDGIETLLPTDIRSSERMPHERIAPAFDDGPAHDLRAPAVPAPRPATDIRRDRPETARAVPVIEPAPQQADAPTPVPVSLPTPEPADRPSPAEMHPANDPMPASRAVPVPSQTAVTQNPQSPPAPRETVAQAAPPSAPARRVPQTAEEASVIGSLASDRIAQRMRSLRWR